MDSSALLAHILSQTRQNIELLMTHNQISSVDGRSILAKLPASGAPSLEASIASLSRDTANLSVATSIPSAPGPPSSYVPQSASAPSPSPSPYPIPPGPPGPVKNNQAKALWPYNESGSDPNDLSFRTGDIIDIVEETNEDWWTGRFNGKQGLFPSNYVERLPSNPGRPTPPRQPSYTPYSPPSGGQGGYQPPPGPSPGPPSGYSPGYPPPGGYQGPPVGYQPPIGYQGPPPQSYQPGPVVVENTAQEPPKKHKFGKLGNTMAQSAAGGVGFGAGAAIGGGIINSIF